MPHSTADNLITGDCC